MDTTILLTTNALLSAAAALVMWVFLRTRKTYPGFGLWTAGVACLALGAAMLVPGALPQTWVVRVMRNGVLLGGLWLLFRGMLLFRGLQLSYRWDGLLACLFLGVFGYYSLDAAQINARIVLYCVLAGLICVATAIVTLRKRPSYFGSSDVMLALWMLVYGALSFVRIALQLSDPATSTAFEALKGFGSFYAMAQILTVQLVALTLISMNSQRIEFDFSRSEASLVDSEARVRSIGDNLPDGFVYLFHIQQDKSYFSYISAGVEKMLGLTPSEVLADAQRFFSLMAPESHAQYLQDEARCLRERVEYSGVLLFHRLDGRQLWLQARSAPKVLESGEIAWAGVAVDITQLKSAEAELEQHRNHLEDMVQERTVALAQATRVAEAANASKSNFLANMSHEIRTPLNAITGMAYLVRKEGLTASQSDKLKTLEAASQHLLSIINDILDLSKIDANKLRVEHAPVLVDSVVSNVLAMVAERAREKHIALVGEVHDVPPHLSGDVTRLQQALLNYASNAVKFTEAGRITVSARCVEQTHDVALVRFEVCDTGIGIEAPVLERLFSEFEQADNTTTRKYGGTGLGLAITRRLASLMGGEAGAHSVPGAGSTFWFTAALRKVDEVPVLTNPDAAESAIHILQQQFHGRRILVVDDEPVNSEIASIFLTDAGLAVDMAEHGLQAVEMASRQVYDAVLMDMQMPHMDGLGATRMIRTLSGYAQVPIIAMTANAFAEDRAQCLAAGMSGFISKPVPPAELYQTLVAALR